MTNCDSNQWWMKAWVLPPQGWLNFTQFVWTLISALIDCFGFRLQYKMILQQWKVAEQRGEGVWHSPFVPVSLCTGICRGQHKGAFVSPGTWGLGTKTDTQSFSLTIDSASLIVIIPHFLKLPPTPTSRSLTSLISSPPSLLSHLLLSWLNYSWWFMVPNDQCAADIEGVIPLESCVLLCVCVDWMCMCGWLAEF